MLWILSAVLGEITVGPQLSDEGGEEKSASTIFTGPGCFALQLANNNEYACTIDDKVVVYTCTVKNPSSNHYDITDSD